VSLEEQIEKSTEAKIQPLYTAKFIGQKNGTGEIGFRNSGFQRERKIS
jgi:hypothetical protein